MNIISKKDILKSIRQSKAKSFTDIDCDCSDRDFIGACLDIYNENPNRYYKFIEEYVHQGCLWVYTIYNKL